MLSFLMGPSLIVAPAEVLSSCQQTLARSGRMWSAPRIARLAVLVGLVSACRTVGDLLEPFLPDAAERVRRQCAGRRLPRPEPVFRRLG
jgi:hypothetical protein